jgi:hypothetical protein
MTNHFGYYQNEGKVELKLDLPPLVKVKKNCQASTVTEPVTSVSAASE